jgi:hypothetical protein
MGVLVLLSLVAGCSLDDSTSDTTNTNTANNNASGSEYYIDVVENQSMSEGEELTLSVTGNAPRTLAADLDIEGLPSFATLTPLSNDSVQLVLKPGYRASGLYQITVSFPLDEGGYAAQTFHITILDKQPPLGDLAFTPISDVSLSEGGRRDIVIQSNAVDYENVVFSHSDLPPFTNFFYDEYLQEGYFTITPGFDSSGEYEIEFTVSVDGYQVTEKLSVSVEDITAKIEPVADIIVNEGESLTVSLRSQFSTEEGYFDIYLSGLPQNAVFKDDSFGTWTLTLNPDYNASGTYEITATSKYRTYYGTDSLQETATFNIIVNDTPPPPRKPLRITEDNFITSSNAAMESIEVSLALAYVTDGIVSRSFASESFPSSYSCDNGGNTIITLIDNDDNGKATVGDVLSVLFKDCIDDRVKTLVAGTVEVKLEPFTVKDGFNNGYSATLKLSDTGIRASASYYWYDDPFERYTGELKLEFNENRYSSLLEISAESILIVPPVENSYGDKPVYEYNLNNIQIDKKLSRETARYELNASGTYDSLSLGGILNFSTVNPLAGYFNTYPDEGEYRVAGAAGNSIAISANYVLASSEAKIVLVDNVGLEITKGRISWSSITNGIFWWNPVLGNNLWGRDFDINRFYKISESDYSDQPEVGVNEEILLQFSRKIDPAIELEPIKYKPSLPAGSPNAEEILADVEVKGAMLIVSPSTQLKYGTKYQLTSIPLADSYGNTTSSGDEYFRTPDTLKATFSTDQLFGFVGDRISVDSLGSFSADSDIKTYEWTELTDYGVVIDDDTAADTTLTMPDVEDATEVLIELKITNENGEYDWYKQAIQLFPSAAELSIMYFTSEENSSTGGGETHVLANSNGSIMPLRNEYNGITLSYSGDVNWSLNLVAANREEIEVGQYTSVRVYPYQSVSEHGMLLSSQYHYCYGLTGNFEILEVEYDGDGKVLKLAVDFEQRCSGDASGAFKGYARYNSSVPIEG